MHNIFQLKKVLKKKYTSINFGKNSNIFISNNVFVRKCFKKYHKNYLMSQLIRGEKVCTL